MYDIIIVGSGIIGSMLAYDLSHFNVSVCVLEKNVEIMNEVSSSNSGLIHAGYDPEDNSLKAILNLRGAKRYPEIAKLLNVDYQQVGSLLVARSEDEIETLNQLEARANQRNIPCRRVNQNEVREMEPNISDSVLEAVYFPTTAIITPWQMGFACMNYAVLNGVELKRQTKVLGIEKIASGYKVLTNNGEFTSKVVINCSGLMGVEVAKYHNPNTQHRIEFRKGEYQVSDVRDANYLNHVIYPTPSKLGKGVLALKTVEGNLMFGPTSRVIENGYDFSTTQSGLAEVDEKIKNIIKPLPKSCMIRQFAGVRPTSLSKDFIIEDLDGFVNVIGIDSPGLASSPGISEYVIEHFLSNQLELKLKEQLIDFKWKKHLSLDERKELIKQDARFGKIVCVCETISEKEILDAIHLPVGAHSVKGVKRLVRPGSGRCQGGFCESEVVRLLAQELNIDMDKVPFDNDCFLYPLGDHNEKL